MTTAATLLSLLLAVAAAMFVLTPLLQKPGRASVVSARLGRARELQSRREMALASLKDLEDDRATDKIDDADYHELHGRLSGEAVEIMRELDTVEAEHAQAELADHPVLSYRRPDPTR